MNAAVQSPAVNAHFWGIRTACAKRQSFLLPDQNPRFHTFISLRIAPSEQAEIRGGLVRSVNKAGKPCLQANKAGKPCLQNASPKSGEKKMARLDKCPFSLGHGVSNIDLGKHRHTFGGG